jgi:hypothetical protein
MFNETVTIPLKCAIVPHLSADMILGRDFYHQEDVSISSVDPVTNIKTIWLSKRGVGIPWELARTKEAWERTQAQEGINLEVQAVVRTLAWKKQATQLEENTIGVERSERQGVVDDILSHEDQNLEERFLGMSPTHSGGRAPHKTHTRLSQTIKETPWKKGYTKPAIHWDGPS